MRRVAKMSRNVTLTRCNSSKLARVKQQTESDGMREVQNTMRKLQRHMPQKNKAVRN